MKRLYGDPQLVALQEEVERATRAARENPRNAGRSVQVVIPATGGGDVTVEHKLGRVPVGYEVRRVISSGGDWAFQESERKASKLVLTGTGSASATVELWVY